jgi:chromosome segregation ATPase
VTAPAQPDRCDFCNPPCPFGCPCGCHEAPAPCAKPASERMSEEVFEYAAKFRAFDQHSKALLAEARRAREAERILRSHVEIACKEAEQLRADLAEWKKLAGIYLDAMDEANEKVASLRADLAREKQNVQTLIKQKWEERDVYHRVVNERDALAEEVRNWKHEAESAKFDEQQAIAARAERDALAERVEKLEGESDELSRKAQEFEKQVRVVHEDAEARVAKLEADLARERERADYHAKALLDLAQAVALKLNPIGCDGATVYEKVCKAVERIERLRFLLYHVKVECPDGYENRCDECDEVRAIVREEAAKS